MVAVNRGSTSRISAIKEATPGTTPATPTLIEMPINSFTPTVSNTIIRGNAIRSHPFPDAILHGRTAYDFGLDFDLQGAVHDMVFETMFGGTISAKALVFADALKSLTLEERVKTGLFNSFTYGHFTSLGISASAGDTTPVVVTTSGSAIAAALDAGATIATATTAAAVVDPFIFAGATLTVAAAATPVGSGSLNFERAVDPLMLLGARTPREFVPGAVTATGQITVPYDDTGNASGATMSALAVNFTDAALVWNFGNEGNTVFRKFTLPKCNFSSLGRSLTDRGMRMQEINYEAKNDSATSTICTMTTE